MAWYAQGSVVVACVLDPQFAGVFESWMCKERRNDGFVVFGNNQVAVLHGFGNDFEYFASAWFFHVVGHAKSCVEVCRGAHV